MRSTDNLSLSAWGFRQTVRVVQFLLRSYFLCSCGAMWHMLRFPRPSFGGPTILFYMSRHNE